MARNYENIGGAGQNAYNGSEWVQPGMESAREAIENAEKLSDEEAKKVGEKVIAAAEAAENTESETPAEEVTEETVEVEPEEGAEAPEEAPAEQAPGEQSIEDQIRELEEESSRLSMEVATIKEQLGTLSGIEYEGARDKYTDVVAQQALVNAKIAELNRVRAGGAMDEQAMADGMAPEAAAPEMPAPAQEAEDKDPVEARRDALKIDEQKWLSEIAEIEKELAPYDETPEAIQRDYEHAKARLEEVQTELAQIESERPELAEQEMPIPAPEMPMSPEPTMTPEMPANFEVNNTAETSAEIDTLTPEETRATTLIYDADEIGKLIGEPDLVQRVREALAQKTATSEAEDFASTEDGATPSVEEFVIPEVPVEAEQLAEEQAETPEGGQESPERTKMVAAIFEKMKAAGERIGSSPIGRRMKRVLASAALFLTTAAAGFGAFSNTAQAADRSTKAQAATKVEASAKAGGGAVDLSEYDAIQNGMEKLAEDAGSGEDSAAESEGKLVEAVNMKAIEPTIELHKAKNGTLYNYSDNFDRTDKTGRNAFGGSVTEYHGDIPGMKEAIVNECMQSPEVLAAYVASIPEAFGLKSGVTAEEIDDKLSNGENGGKLQAKYMEKLTNLLADENTKTKFIRSHAVQESYIIVKTNPDKKSTPKNLKVQSYSKEMKRHGDKQVIFSIPLYDDAGQISDWVTLQVNEGCVQPVEDKEKSPDDREDPPKVTVVTPEPVTPDQPDQPDQPERPDEPDTPEVSQTPQPTNTPEVSQTPQPTPTVKPKDPESVVDHGANGTDKNNAMTKEENTEENETKQGTEQKKHEEMVNDTTGDEQGKKDQQEAEESKDTSAKTNDEILDYLDQFYNRIYDQQRGYNEDETEN